MKYKIYKLFPYNYCHIKVSEGRLDRASMFIHSDTLFSGLINCYTKLFGEKDLDIFIDNLVISSLFYGLKFSNQELFFVPKPLLIVKNFDNLKEFKKLNWVSIKSLEKLLSKFDGESTIFKLDEFIFLNSQFLITKEEKFTELKEDIKFVDTIIEPKVNIDRTSYFSKYLYFQEEIMIKKIFINEKLILEPFLYFIVEEPIEHLTSILNMLVEDGIGGERNFGKGVFSFWEEGEIDIPNSSDYGMLLSLTIPKNEELEKVIFYKLIKKDGFIYYNQPLGLKKIKHFKIQEGSIVKMPFMGQNINVSPINDIKVISYGKSFCWPF